MTTSPRLGPPVVDGPHAVGNGVDEPPPARRTGPGWAVLWLAAAWLVPVATHLVAVDWLLPPLVLLVTASLLRGGRTLLDRLMLSAAVLLGTLCGASLIFTFWPFGFEPVAVAGTALTVLVTISLATGRRPQLPRPAFTDGLTAAAALGVFAYVAIPYARTGSAGRLAMMMAGGEDNPRHVAIFDSLRRLGGLAYRQTPQDLPDVYDLFRYYPSGWHVSAGVLDSFVRSSAEVGDMPGAMDHFVWFAVAGYGLFALTLLWAAQWIAGPLLGVWRLPLVAFLGIQLVYSDLPVLLIYGFPSEIFGLTLLALLVAVLVRPPSRPREQMVVIGALLVGIGFSYEFFLPSALLAVAGWALHRRRTVRRHLLFAVVAGAVAGLLAVTPITLGVLYGSHAKLVQATGPVHPTSRALLLSLALVLAAALATQSLRRLRVWRSYVLAAAAVLALPAALHVYEAVSGLPVTYYYEKALHAVLIVSLIGLGATVSLLGRPTARLPVRRLTAAAVPAVLVTAAMAIGSGMVMDDTRSQPGRAERMSRAWHSGWPTRTAGAWAATLLEANRLYPPRPDGLTIVCGHGFLETYLSTLYLSMLQRTSGRTAVIMYQGAGLFSDEATYIAESLARPGVPVRLVVISPNAEKTVADVKVLKPDLELEVVRLY